MTTLTSRLRPAARLVSLPVSRTGRTLVILLGFVAVLDIVTTSIGLALGNGIYEQNVIGHVLWTAGGPFGLIAAKLASFTVIALAWRVGASRFDAVHGRRLTSLILVFLIVVNATAAVANIFTLVNVPSPT